MDLLTVEHVTKRYAEHTALDDVSLSIPKGSVYGLLGPNGAGKTTLIRIINCITAPDTGRVLLGGREIAPEDVRRIGYLPEERGLYKKMKVGEQAVFFARLKGLSRREAVARLKKWFVKFGIEGWWDKKIEELSKGMAQKVQFIVTVLHEPELLIFDEPFSGFSVEEICDHITLINKSKNILSGRVDEIRRHHGANIFEVAYRGEEADLRRAVEGRCEILEGAAEESAYRTLKLHVERDEEVRQVIDAANRAVELRSFREIIPSMNDIFIRAVNGQL